MTTPVYTYITDLPYINATDNKRGFYKLPRSILLPPYLAINPYFVDYANSIDTVFDYIVEARIDALSQIRNMWVTTKESEQKIKNKEMLQFTDWGGPEREIVVQQVNLLGMKLANSGVVSEGAYRAIAKFLGSYWFGKGKGAAIDFLNFCLGSGLSITKLVTQDYIEFLPETSEHVGAYIFDTPPGPWYPTTHVQIGMPLSYGISPLTLGSFFYEICNYNLVLYAVATILDFKAITWDSDSEAKIIAAGAFGQYLIVGPTPYYPIKYHSRMGGWTGGMNKTLTQISTVEWPNDWAGAN